MAKQKHSYSSAKERADKRTSGFDSTSIKLPEGAQLFKVTKPGIYRLDIIPFVAGAGNPFADEGVLHYERTYHVHRGIGANGDTYVCPSKTLDQPCPICEHRRKLMKDPEANEELIKDLAPKERQLFQLIDLGAPEKGVQIWDVSYHLFGKLLDARIRDAEDGDDYHMFYHLEKGLTLRVGFTERSFGGVTFYEAETIDFKPRKEPYDEDVLEKGYCLDELLKVVSYDKLKAALLQTEDDDSGDDEKPKKKKPAADTDDEDDAPPAKKKKPADEDDDEDDAPPAKKKPADDDDDEDDAPPAKKKKPADDDDDEDAPPPKKKSAPADDEDDAPPAKKKAAPADDDDWDDDAPPAKKKKPADDEDDEEPAPKKKKPAASDDDKDDAPPAKKKKPADEDDDDAPPAKKKKAANDDDWDD